MMAWYTVIILVSSIGHAIQYPNAYFEYTVQKGSDVHISPVIVTLSNSGLMTWHVEVISSHSTTSYTSFNVPLYISYNESNNTFTITNVTTEMHYHFKLDDGARWYFATVHVIVYGK